MITSGVTVAAKLQFLQSIVNDNCKVALYTTQADLNTETKKYTSAGEVKGQGYKPGGFSLKGCRVWEDRGSACLTWDSVTIPNASITAAGFMIYDASKNDTAIFVGSYGAEYTSSHGPFTINIASDQIVFT